MVRHNTMATVQTNAKPCAVLVISYKNSKLLRMVKFGQRGKGLIYFCPAHCVVALDTITLDIRQFYFSATLVKEVLWRS